MELLMKAAAAALVTIVLSLVVSKQNKESALLLIVAACCMIAAAAMTYLQPVVDFLQHLQSVGNLDPEMLSILLKAAGITLLAEIVGMICADAGNGALGKTLQLLATAVVIWLSLPLLSRLLELIENILVSI